MLKRIFIGICCLMTTWSVVQAAGWTPETVPSPKEKGQNYYVSNPDGVLQPSTESRLNAGLTQLNHDTEVEMAVVAVDKMSQEKSYSAYGFALKLFNLWGIGSAEKNTGVLVFLSKGTRQIRIITGDGIAGILTDRRCGEILDDNLDYFKNNDYDEGILHVCQDIANDLMMDVNRAELMLGWKPGDTEANGFWTWYFLIGFFLLAICAWFGLKTLNSGKPGERVEYVKDRADTARMIIGFFTWIFPVPLLIYYILHRILRNKLQMKPLQCEKCGHDMDLVPVEEHKGYMSPAQMTQEKIQSREFDVWHCPDCGEKQIKEYRGKNHYAYTECPECGALAVDKVDFKVTKRATQSEKGVQINYYECLCCGHKYEKTIELRRLPEHSSSKSDSDTISWTENISFMRTSSSSPSGSWGGGHSSGGGAGRSF